MTIEEYFKDKLFNCGLFPDQAEQVVAMAKEDDQMFPDMKDRWGQSKDGYPPAFMAVLWSGIRFVTLKWIDANVPQAWYRPMFA